jgi:hypothetical protein
MMSECLGFHDVLQLFVIAGFTQNEENACVYVSIKSRETPSNTGITLFVRVNSLFILVGEDDEFILSALRFSS